MPDIVGNGNVSDRLSSQPKPQLSEPTLCGQATTTTMDTTSGRAHSLPALGPTGASSDQHFTLEPSSASDVRDDGAMASLARPSCAPESQLQELGGALDAPSVEHAPSDASFKHGDRPMGGMKAVFDQGIGEHLPSSPYGAIQFLPFSFLIHIYSFIQD